MASEVTLRSRTDDDNSEGVDVPEVGIATKKRGDSVDVVHR